MDVLANMIIMIKNAGLASHKTVVFPHSKLKESICACLKKEGFIADFSKKNRQGMPAIEVELLFVENKPKISNVERVSKQSRRVYLGAKEIHSVRNGTGMLVLSTPKGILSGKQARKEQVGGEVLFKIW